MRAGIGSDAARMAQDAQARKTMPSALAMGLANAKGHGAGADHGAGGGDVVGAGRWASGPTQATGSAATVVAKSTQPVGAGHKSSGRSFSARLARMSLLSFARSTRAISGASSERHPERRPE